jgi:hypothetical protein
MFKNRMAVVAAAALVLGSFLVVTDASAAGRGGHGAGNHAVRTGGQGQKSSVSRYTAPNRINGNAGINGFSMSGPYIGTKFIGNQ